MDAFFSRVDDLFTVLRGLWLTWYGRTIHGRSTASLCEFRLVIVLTKQ